MTSDPEGLLAISTRRKTACSFLTSTSIPTTFLGAGGILSRCLGGRALSNERGAAGDEGARGKGIVVKAGIEAVVVGRVRIGVLGVVGVLAVAGVLGVVVIADIGVHCAIGSAGVVGVIGATAECGVVVGVVLVTEGAGGGGVREVGGALSGGGAGAGGVILLE